MMRDDLAGVRRPRTRLGEGVMNEDSTVEPEVGSDLQSESPTRLVRVPTLGSKLSVLAALLLLVLAVYFLLSPAQVQARGGRNFDCGSAISGPATAFAEGICGSANDVQRAKAYASGAAALLVGVGGVVCFGFQSRRETATVAIGDEEEN
jgi:hypothetical protein